MIDFLLAALPFILLPFVFVFGFIYPMALLGSVMEYGWKERLTMREFLADLRR